MKVLSNRKKGMSLAEIVVVLAVVAIVSTIVVSFSIMVDNKTRVSNAKVDAVSDIRVVESVIDGWVYRHTLDGGKFVIDDGNISCTVGGEVYKLSFDSEDGYLLGELPNNDEGEEEKLWFYTKCIESISFEMFHKNTDDNVDEDVLIMCTINYYLVDNASMKYLTTYVFCVNEYVGDII